MHARWLGLGLCLLGCASRSATTTTSAGPAVAEQARQKDPALLAVAESIDPGPQTPLLLELPTALREPIERALGVSVDQKLAISEIQSALQMWDKLGTSTDTFLQNLTRIGVGLVRAERAVTAGADDAELLLALGRVYFILDTPVFAGQGIFQQVLQVAGQVAQSMGKEAVSLDMGALAGGLARVFSRAGAMHRRNAAEFLRRHGDHPEVPRVLGRLAEDATRREQFDRSLELRQMAMLRLGGRATAGDHIDLATSCYRALDLAGGDAAVKRARELGDPSDAKAAVAEARRLEDVAKFGERARRVRAIPADAPLTLALERGHLLLLLDRFTEAAALFEQLRAAHPEDARPLGGLAKLAIQRSANFTLASALVDRGKSLGSKDRDFYEVALGTIGMKFLYEALPAIAGGQKFDDLVPPLLADLRSFAAGLRVDDPARASVVELIMSVVEAAAPGFLAGKTEAALPALRPALPHALKLEGQFPDSPDVRRMVYLAANFTADRESALAAVRKPPVTGDVGLQRSRARTWLGLALVWEAAEELPQIEAAVAALTEEEGDRSRRAMQAALLAVRARRSGAREPAEQAAAIYMALASEGPTEERAAALNNLGLLQILLGDPEAGAKRLVEALNLDAKAWPALMNLAATVMTLEGTQRAELMEAFAVVARDGESSPLRVQANAWRYEQAQKGSGDVEQTRKDFAASLAKERQGELRGSMPLGRWGLLSIGSAQVSFNYSVPTGFQIRNEIDMTLWLIEPPPSLDALIAAVDAVKQPVKQPAKPMKKARAAR